MSKQAPWLDRSSLPFAGSVIAGLSAGFDGGADDALLPERQRATLY